MTNVKHTLIKVRNVSVIPKVPLGFFPFNNLSPHNGCSDGYHHRFVLPITELHLSGIIQYILRYVWLPFYSIILRFTHDVCLSVVGSSLLPVIFQCTDISQSVCSQLMDIWVVSNLGLLGILPPQTFFFFFKSILEGVRNGKK